MEIVPPLMENHIKQQMEAEMKTESLQGHIRFRA